MQAQLRLGTELKAVDGIETLDWDAVRLPTGVQNWRSADDGERRAVYSDHGRQNA